MAVDMRALSRIVAVWIVALILAPYSAPFSVCEPLVPSHRAASVSDSTRHALPVTRTLKRVNVIDALNRASVRSPIVSTSFGERRPMAFTVNNAPLASPLRI